MESTPLMYRPLTHVLGCHQNWLDIRHLKTLAWMINGLLLSGKIGLDAWAMYVQSRAHYLSSTIRRFHRFLENDRIDVHRLYAPLLHQALQGWEGQKVYVALDTSLLWNSYCLVRLSLIYRGRAIPLVWNVLKHNSATMAYQDYRPLLTKAAQLLFPFQCKVILLADRGFADIRLLRQLILLGWHFRIRIKDSLFIYRKGRPRQKAKMIRLRAGHPKFWHNVEISEERLGPLHLALGRPLKRQDRWMVLSDEPTGLDTFREYGLRFGIEENFLDDKSNGFQLETSKIRSPKALERLCFVLAVATVYLVSQGTKVVEAGKRRLVDAHWFRGNSYLKIGWNWIRRALLKKEKLLTHLALSPKPDPEPAMASKKQHRKHTQSRCFAALRSAA